MTGQGHRASDFSVGAWIVRPSLSRIERDNLVVHVTPRAMSVLVYLGSANGAVVSRNELLDNVWPRMTVTSDALSQCIVELRRAFGDDCRHPHIIETIPRMGLRLIAPVTPLSVEPLVKAAPLLAGHAPQWRPWAAALGVAAIVIAATLLSS